MLLIGVFALVLMLANPASAEPISVSILTALAITATPGAIAVTTAIVSTIISMALSYVASALLKPAGRSGGSAGMPDTSLNSKASVRQPTAPLQVVYGKTKVGGVFADMWVSDATNQLLCGALIIAGHEITGIDELWLGDENTILDANGYITGGRYAGNGTFLQYFGTDNQTACQMLIDNSNGRWTSNHRLRGLAYLAFQLYWDNTTGNGNPASGTFVVEHRGAKLWQGALPNMTAVIRGRKIYDPRTGQTAYSNNSALVVADYLCDKTFGLGVDYATGIDENALISAANACDELVTLDAGGTEKRYTTDGFFKVDGSPDAILGRLLGAMHGQAIYDGERWVIKAGIWEEPDAIVLTDDDMRAASSLQTLTSTRDIANGVKGTYVGAETKWQPADFPSIKSATFTTDDGGVDKWRDIELPYSSTATRCQRLAKIDLLKQRYEIVETFKGKLSCWRYTAGQTVYRTSERYGWTNKAFMVGSVRVVPDQDAEGNPMVGVDLTLYETAASIYNWSTSEETPIRTPTKPTMPDLYNVTAPTGFTTTESTYTTEGGQGIKSKVLLAWTASQDALVKLGGWYELQYKLSADTAWTSLPNTTATAAEVLDVKPATYNYRLRAVNYAGNPSAWISTTLTVSGDTTPPEDVVGFASLSGVSGYTTFSWTAPVNERARNGSAEIRYATATSGATWSSATAIVIQSALNTTATVQTNIGTYLIKYKSANGIYSGNAASVAITTTAQPKVGIDIVSALPTTDLYEGRIVYLSTDDKLYRYTGSAWTTAVAAVDLSGTLAAANFPSDLRPVELVTALPTTGLTNGRVVFLTTDGKLYRYVTGTGWTAAVPAADVSGALAAANFPSDLRPVELVSTLPTSGNFAGRMAYLTTDSKLYRYNGTAWTAAVQATDISGTLNDAQIAALAASKITGQLSASQIAALEATKITGQLADSQLAAISTAKLTGQITSTQITDGAISTPKLAAGSVTANSLAANSVTASAIAANSISSTSLQSGSVTTAALAAGSVTATAIAASSISATALQSGSVTAASIAAGSIQASALAANSVTSSAIAANSISATALQSDSVTAGKIAAAAISTAALQSGVITADKLAANSVTASAVAANSISASALQSDSVTAGKIAAAAISTAALQSNVITSDKIAASAIQSTHLSSGSVTADAITAGAVTAAKVSVTNLSAISANLGTITAGTVTGATHQTASAGAVRAVMDTRTMFRCEDPSYYLRSYYRSVGWSEPNITSHIGAEAGQSYSRLLNFSGNTCLDIQSFGDNVSGTPWTTTPNACGVTSRGTNIGVAGVSESNAGVTGAGAVWDFYANGSGSNYGPFTGSHDALIEKTTDVEIGDIVVDVELIAQKSVSNAITRVEPSSAADQKGALGVVCKRMDVSENMPPAALAGDPVEGVFYPVIDPAYTGYITTHDRLLVNAVGEGLINVCGQGGDIAIGDLIVTSDTAGKGMKQSDDIVRARTVAKAREAATFATAGEVKTIACIYVSG